MMKQLRLFLIILSLGCMTASLQAQTVVTISFHTAADQTLTVSESGKLYFSDQYLYVNEGSGIPYSFLLSAISKITFADGTGVEDIVTDQVHIYPNPAHDYIRICNLQETSSIYSLYSYDGRLLQSGTCQNDESISLSRYAKGLYLLKVDGLTFKISKL